MKIFVFIVIMLTEISISLSANLIEYKKFTGDWGGLRTTFNEHGFDLNCRYIFDIFQIQKQDNKQPALFYIQNIDLDFIFDFERLFGLEGGTLLFDLQGMNGGNPNFNVIRSFQGVSNIEAWNNFLIYEFWYRQNFDGDKFSLLFGLFDLNSEFDVSPAKSNFITPAHGTGTDFALTGKLGPSVFPLTSLALRAKYKFSEKCNISLAVFDGLPGDTNNLHGTHIVLKNSDGLLVVSEADLSIYGEDSDSGFPVFKLGLWYYTDKYTHFVTGIKQWGVYCIGEIKLLSEGENIKNGLTASLRLGYSDPNTNFTDIYTGLTFEYKGLLPKRDNDFCGLGFAFSRLTPYFHKRFSADTYMSHHFDLNAEFFYKMNLTGFLALQPVISYFYSPAFNPKYMHYFVGGLRLHIIL